MDSPREEESEDEETDWLEEANNNNNMKSNKAAAHHHQPPPAPCPGTMARCEPPPGRVIVHLDMDCFYAQVEMIRQPHLRDRPLGVQQKYVVITCNYEARRFGVRKCMGVREAKEKCPQLVLVSGEDLTNYREISYKVTELLEEFSRKVERLGFDENFIDVTELVERRLREQQTSHTAEVSGHVYNDQPVSVSDWTHRRLLMGSHVAADIRAAVHSRLGLTGCAGVASNKLLAKLVSGTFKPNQQTVLLPESSGHLLSSLEHVNRIPGIGYKTAQHLQGLGLTSVSALRSCPITVLEKVLGASVAHRIQKLSRGEDESPVTPSGLPQSLSEEDSFKKCSTVSEVTVKLEELLRGLLHRLSGDERSPHTLRLTIRQFSPTNKYFNRESRQCPVPLHVIQSLGSDGSSAVVSSLMELLMKLFEKMIDVRLPFHLTLLNVCFSNLKPSKSSTTRRNSIGFYLGQKREAASDGSQVNELHETPDSDVASNRPPCKRPLTSSAADPLASHSLPENIDMEVFSQLPEDIRNEILSGQTPGGAQTSDRTPGGAQTSDRTPGGAQASDRTPEGAQASDRTPRGAHAFGRTPRRTHTTSRTPGGMHTTGRTPGGAQASGRTPACKGIQHFFTTAKAENSHDSRTEQGPSSLSRETGSASECTETPRDLSDRCQGTDILAPVTSGSDSSVPESVDLDVYSQLPAELQKELMTEWKHRKLTPKILVRKSLEKVRTPKGQRSHPKAPTQQPNNLMKYFKPG